MLKWRVATAAVLAAAVVWLVWFAPLVLLPAAFVAVGAVAAWEWARLVGITGVAARLAFAAAAVVSFAGAWWLAAVAPPRLVAGLCLAVWLPAAVLLLRYIAGGRRPLPRAGAMVFALILLAAAWLAVVAPFLWPSAGPFWLTALFVMVWGSDIGGYFAGRRWGRRRLAPAVSPGKTWEGAAGGLVLAVLGLGALIYGLDAAGYFRGAPPWWHLMAAPAVVVAAIAGDLFESMLKRQAGVKDSSHIVPGHGGVLDRVDALLMAAPVYAAVAAWGG